MTERDFSGIAPSSMTHLLGALDDDRDLYWCPMCGGVDDQVVTIRECPQDSCGMNFFNADDNGRNCPDCNRPFTRLANELGCRECEDESECELLGPDDRTELRDWLTTEMAKPPPKVKTKEERAQERHEMDRSMYGDVVDRARFEIPMPFDHKAMTRVRILDDGSLEIYCDQPMVVLPDVSNTIRIKVRDRV